MKYVYFDFPNGERWRVPARLIADDRARYYAEKDHPNDVEAQREAKAIEVDFALNDSAELFDWLRNNMDWEDVEPHATQIDGPQEVDKSDFYNTADLDLVDVDPNDDPDKPEGTPRGIYLVADTPTTLTPLAVEDGSGDHALLREAIEEADVDGIDVTHPTDE